ncbi:hypothetical protein LTR91_014072 [Friedmanniomyces endolithicus]|uniref:Uncharacterized protein n=1 Tax=Friedmanniomyces endolithicus TaxID=329885 RepID=A0AAN6F5L3_9PEZI|nr:hypothetical protein LTS09_017675 [Friedmanniomyces endolithicus]KAK0263663.1 hypothetical protein LTR35_017469 [Friedmanniomyces endolithicus]KAK0269441.1 hypothetical protein LTS00_017273 [Friedmanniomyces endolithicus]KAK0303539.1 hypothetical protein LTR82_017529 [Friedmanniomyces endolithicus]KAK0826851.1 hypothetical protein LTR73_006186 [Friedmanniomyces endolithicus]
MPLSDSIYHFRAGQGPTKKSLLVFFITGNPGLIDYYHVTLNCLFATLCARDSDTELHVCGTSLAGFDTSPTPKHTSKALPVGLAEQTQYVTGRLISTARIISKQWDGETIPVVLVGHSIGSYMLLDIIAEWQATPAESRPPMDLVGGICLFPTVVDIAKSPTGRAVAPLLRLPGSTLLVHLIVRLIFYFVPIFIMTLLIRMLTRFELAAAKTTARFLKSKHGVRQGLFLAKDELKTVRSDAWPDSLWGIRPLQEFTSTITDVTNANDLRKDSAIRKRSSTTTTPIHTKSLGIPTSLTRLYFYWAADDHWVAVSTRDQLIATRGRHGGGKGEVSSLEEACKPVMEIDKHGIPHAFPVVAEHGRAVAGKVAEWIGQITAAL